MSATIYELHSNDGIAQDVPRDARKQLRIGVWHNLPSGGGKRALFDQLRGLAERGHHIEVWSPPTANQQFLPLHGLVPEHVVPLAGLPNSLGNRCRYWLGLPYSVSAEMERMDDHCRICAEQITVRNFDLLLAHPCQRFRTSAIAKYLRIPTVLYLQEPFRELYEAWPRLPWEAPENRSYSPKSMKARLRDTLKIGQLRTQVRVERQWASDFDQILVNSQFSRESMLRAYNLDSRVCYLGVDLEHFRPTGAAKEPFVVGLGNIHFNKRVDWAIRAVAAIHASARPPLVWIGNFASEGYVRELHALAARAQVNFAAKTLVSEDELRDLLSRASVMIYGSHLEPFGYAPLEANACGTGVVAVAEGGIRETVTDGVNGFLVPNLDAEAFAQNVRRFTDDLSFAASFGTGARQHVADKWSLQTAIGNIEAELRRLLETTSAKASLRGACI